jgi:hypothetical protein
VPGPGSWATWTSSPAHVSALSRPGIRRVSPLIDVTVIIALLPVSTPAPRRACMGATLMVAGELHGVVVSGQRALARFLQ